MRTYRRVPEPLGEDCEEGLPEGVMRELKKPKWAEGREIRVIGCSSYHNVSSHMINVPVLTYLHNKSP